MARTTTNRARVLAAAAGAVLAVSLTGCAEYGPEETPPGNVETEDSNDDGGFGDDADDGDDGPAAGSDDGSGATENPVEDVEDSPTADSDGDGEEGVVDGSGDDSDD